MSRRSAKSQRLYRKLRLEQMEKRLLLFAGSDAMTESMSAMDQMHTAPTHGEMSHEMVAGDQGQGDATHDHVSHNHGEGVEVPADEMAPTIRVSATNDYVGGVHLQVDLEHFHLSEDSVDAEHQFGEGHLHVYVDEVKIGRFYSEQIHLSDLLPGIRTIRAEISANDHRIYTLNGQPIEASTAIIVPEVSVPASSESEITTIEEGNELVEAESPALPLQNADLPQDVNASGFVEPLDVLITVNWLNSIGIRSAAGLSPEMDNGSYAFVDVSGDNFVTPLDAINVINFINAATLEAEGEEMANADSMVAKLDAPTLMWTAELDRDLNQEDELLELLANAVQHDHLQLTGLRPSLVFEI